MTINKALGQALGLEPLVEEAEIEEVRKNLESTSLLSNELGIDWIANNLLNVENRLAKHSLFWLFLEPPKFQKMENWLKIVKSCIPKSKFLKIINSLKERRDEKDFYSLLAEIEVLAFYGSKGIKVEYEPNIPKKKNIGDIKLIINSFEVFVEVTRLFQSKEEEQIRSLTHLVEQRINAIPNNPFIITLEITDNFSFEDVESFIKLVSEEISKNQDILESGVEKPYTFNFSSKATVLFHKKITNKKGYVGGVLPPTMEVKSAGRLKNKILHELKQLPDNSLNIIAIDVSAHFTDFDDVEDAFTGQLAYLINIHTGEGRTIRNSNGVIHMNDGRQIGLVIAFKGFNYEQHKKYVNSSASMPFTEGLLAQL